jgi:hypothetical protein
MLTPLEEKLNQLSLSTMSRQLETTLTEAAAKNLSAAATLEWLADMELEARQQRAPSTAASKARVYKPSPASTPFTSIITRAASRLTGLPQGDGRLYLVDMIGR